ncbi:MAG: hypothetical protein ABIG44_13225, partial [Planctomycetota bacterium]
SGDQHEVPAIRNPARGSRHIRPSRLKTPPPRAITDPTKLHKTAKAQAQGLKPLATIVRPSGEERPWP